MAQNMTVKLKGGSGDLRGRQLSWQTCLVPLSRVSLVRPVLYPRFTELTNIKIWPTNNYFI